MRYLALIAIMIFFAFALMNGCQNKAETPVNDKPSPVSTETPVAEKITIPAEPDYTVMEKELSVLLDPLQTPPVEKEYALKKIAEVSENIKNCEAKEEKNKCTKEMNANLHLMLGDLHCSVSSFQKSIEPYQTSILNRFESFEEDQKKLQDAMKINSEELKANGKTPQLLAGAAFLEATHGLKAFKDYAEMVRVERRLAQTYDRLKNVQEAENARQRAALGFKKAMEFRMSFEKNKRLLLELVQKLGPEYQSYTQYILAWDNDIKLKQI